MDVQSCSLTTCEISPDGKAVSLGFLDAEGRPAAVTLPIDQLGALAMTLPGLIERAMQLQHSDDTLRYAYPLGTWKFEQSTDPGSSILSLSTADGFQVCFTMRVGQRARLADALAAQHSPASVYCPN